MPIQKEKNYDQAVILFIDFVSYSTSFPTAFCRKQGLKLN
jgi:hypothetical protein